MSNNPNNPSGSSVPTLSFRDYVANVNPSRDVLADPVSVKAEPSQYDTGFVLPEDNPQLALNEHRAYAQPWEDKLGNGLANMTISAFTGALESTVGLVYGAGAALASGDASGFYDNAFGRSMDAITNSVRESNPFYYSEAEKNASLLGGMGYQNFWFDKVLGGAGYTIGSMLAGMGMAKVFQMGKTAQLAQMTDEVSAAAKAGQLSQEALKYSRWDMGKQIALGGVMAHGESSMEARQTYDSGVDNYTKLRALANDPNTDPETKAELAGYANLSDEKIQQLARNAADTNYLMNMAVTGPTDMILLGKFINPGKRTAVRTYNEIGKREAIGGTVEYFDKVVGKKARAALNVGGSFLKGFTTEGAQEGLQFSSNIAAQEFSKLHGVQEEGWFTSIASALAEGLTETLTTKEGLESILVGGLVGGPFGLKGSLSEMKAQDARTKELITALNTDPQFTQGNEKIRGFIASMNSMNNSEEYLKNGNLFEAKNQADQGLNLYIKNQIDLGTTDYFVEKLQSIKEMEQEERDKYFGPGTTPEQIDQVIERVEKLNQLNESIETLYGTPGGTPEQKQRNAQLRQMLFFSAATIKDVEGRISNITKELTGMQNPEVSTLLAARQNVISAYRTELPKTVAQDTNLDEYNEQVRKQAVEQYNNLLKQFELNNPVEAAQTMEMFADLNELDNRKHEFVKYYNELNDPEKAARILEATKQKIAQDNELKTKLAEDITRANAQSKTNLQNVDTLLPLNKDRKQEITHKGQVIDLAQMSDEQLSTFIKTLEDDFQSTGEEATPDTLRALEKEKSLRANTTQIREDLREALKKAKTPEEVDNIIAAIQEDDSFKVDMAEIEKLKANLAKVLEDEARREEAIEQVKNSFKGANEFLHAFSVNEVEKDNLTQALAQNNPERKIYFKIKREPTGGTIVDIGSTERGTLNKRLRKQVPPIVIEVWSNMEGSEPVKVGSLPWYGQYVNYSGNAIDINNLTFDQYVALFLPGMEKEKAEEYINNTDPSKYSLAAFKQAYNDMLGLYAEASNLLGSATEVTLTPEQTRTLSGISITQGSYNIVPTPLSEFLKEETTVNKPVLVDGSPVIVSLSTFDGSQVINKNRPVTTSTRIASVIGESGNPVLINPEDSEGGLRPEMVPALNILGQRVSAPKTGETIYNKYWMLVEDPFGTEMFPGDPKKYDWRPVSPREYTSDESAALLGQLKQLAEQRKTLKDSSAIATNKLRFRTIANQLFIAANSPDAIKSFKSLEIKFTVDPSSKLTVMLDLNGANPLQNTKGEIIKDENGNPVYNGKIYLTVPDNIKTSQDFISWFNNQITKEQKVTPYSTDGKKLDKVDFAFKGMVSPITPSSMRVNFAGDTDSTTKGIKTINPSNVWNSFTVNSSRTIPRTDQKVKVSPVRKAATETMSTIVQSAPAPVPVTISPLPSTLTSGEQETTTAPAIPSSAIEDKKIESAAVLNEYSNREIADIISNKNNTAETFLGKKLSSNEVITDGGKAVQEIYEYGIIQRIFANDGSSIQRVVDYSGKTYGIPLIRLTMDAKEAGLFFDGKKDFSLSEKQITEFFNSKFNIPGAAPAAPVSDKKAERIYSLKMIISSYEEDIISGYEEERKNIISQKNLATNPALVSNLETKIKEYDEVIISAKQSLELAKKELAALEKAPAAPARTSRRKDAGGSAFTGANSIGTYDEGEVIDRNTAIANIKALLPSFIKIEELVETIANLRNGVYTFGSFHNNVIKLAGRIVKGREFHELFHAMFRTMLNDRQLDSMYKEAKNLMITQFKKENKSFVQAYGEWKNERTDYQGLPEDILKDLFIEEWMADEYPKWREGKSVISTKPVTLISKFFDLLKRLVNWISGTPSLSEFFQAIDEGKFSGEKTPVQNRFTNPRVDVSARSQIYVGNREGTDGNTYATFLDPTLEMTMVNTIVSKVLSELKKGSLVPVNELINLEMMELGEMFNVNNPSFDAIAENPRFADVFSKVQDLDFLFNNNEVYDIPATDTSAAQKKNFGIEARQMLVEKISKKLKEFDLEEFDSETNEDNSDGNGDITERNFDLNHENKGGFGSLPKFLRKYIGTTTYNTSLDEFFGLEKGSVFGDQQITVAVNPRKVYNGLTKLCANQVTAENILAKMHYMMLEGGESARFIQKFFTDAGISFEDGKLSYDSRSEGLIQSVVKGFNLFSINYLHTQVDTMFGEEKKPMSNTYAANRKGMDTQQVKSWSQQYDVLKKRNGIEEMKNRAQNVKLGALETITPINDVDLERISSSLKVSLQSVGINLSRMYLKFLILQNRTGKTEAQRMFVEEFQDMVKTNAVNVREALLRTLQLIEKGANNPYTKEGFAEKDEATVTRLLKMAMDNAVFDENVNIQTMQNADGKNIYPYQKANYHVQKIFELRNIDLTETDPVTGELLYPSQIHTEAPNRDYILDNYLINQPEFRAMIKSLAIERIDGLSQKSLQSKEGDLTVKPTNQLGEGVTYGSMTERELLVQFYSLFADSSTDTEVNITLPDSTVEKKLVSARRMIFNIMEASNTADVTTLPVKTMYVDGKLTDAFKDAVFNEIQREMERIERVRNGEYVDNYVNFNALAPTKEQRGRMFWENKGLLEAAGVKTDLENGTKTLEEVRKTIYAEMDSYYQKELDEHFEYLKKAGIIKKDGKNRLLNRKFEGIGTENDAMFNKSLRDNINNAYLNIMMNSTAINQILMGDPALGLKNPVDWFKRAKGNNAAGDNMTHFKSANNTPIKTMVFGRMTSNDPEKAKFDDFVNKDYVLKERIYKINTEEYNKFVESLPEDERMEFLAQKPEEIKIADAQAYTTIKGAKRFMISLGRMTTEGLRIYNNLERGDTLTPEEWKYLKDNNLMLNSQKLVYYDGVTYVKMSIVPLTPEYTSHSNGSQPIKGMEFLHNLRLQMEANDIDMAGQPTMMKKMIKNPLVLAEGQTEFTVDPSNIQDLDPKYLRLQQENPSNKIKIKDPTQMLHLIAAEHNPDTKIDFPWDPKIDTIGKLVKWYDQTLAERINTQLIPARAYFTQLQEGKRNVNIKRIVKAFRRSLEESGASQQLLDYLRVDDQGYPVENFNLPNVVTAFEQHFNSFFNNVFSQKVPGYKTTLQSGFGHTILYNTKTKKIITRSEYLQDPAKYDNDPDIDTRKLAFDVPRIEEGKELYKYSEVVIPFHFAEQFNLKPGDEIPEEIAYLFGTRIPSQDKHSARALKIVDVLPPSYGSNMIMPDELIILTGSDFDVDSFYIHRPDHYFKDGRFMVYGNNEDSKWEQFVQWQIENNSLVSNVIAEISSENPGMTPGEIIRTAFKELDLPITEKAFNDSGMRSMGEINNDLLNARMVMHGNKGMENINKTPATLKAIEDVLKSLATTLGYSKWEELEKVYNPNSPMGMVTAFVTNKAGQKAIGSAVNNSQVYAVLTRFGLANLQKGPKIANVTIGAISPNDFLTLDEKRIMDILSTLTSSMTDNPKYGYNSKMNIDINTLSVLSLMVMNRIPLNIGAKLINSEYVKKYVRDSKSYALQPESETAFQQNSGDALLTEIKNKLIELDPLVNIKTLAAEELTEEELAISMQYSPDRKAFVEATEVQKEAMMNKMPIDDRITYLKAQYKALSVYKELAENHVPEFIAFSQLIKLTKGVTSSSKETSFKGDVEIREYLRKLNLKLVPTEKGWRVETLDPKTSTIYDFKNVINNHLITVENLNLFGEKVSIQKQYFISETTFAQKVVDRLMANISQKLGGKKKKRAIAAMKDNLGAYLMLKAWRHQNNVTENMNAYLFTDVAKSEGIMDMVELKKSILAVNPALEDNLVFSQVFIESKDNINTAKYNTRSKGQKGFESLILGDMRVLVNSEARPLVHHMIKYMIAKEAMLFKNDSPISLINPSTLGTYKFSSYMNQFTPMLNTLNDGQFIEMFGTDMEGLLAEFQELYMRDVNNRDFVPGAKGDVINMTYPDTSDSINPITKTATGFKYDADTGFKRLDEETGDPLELEDTVKNKQAIANNTVAFKLSFETLYRPRINKKGESVKTKVYKYPAYLRVGNSLYKLKSYVPLENRFKAGEKSVSTPDAKGEFVGTAVEYVKVTRFGGKFNGVTITPYGRTIAENEQKSYDSMVEAARLSRKPAEIEATDDEQGDFVDLDEATPLENIGAVQTITKTEAGATEQPEVPEGDKKKMELGNKAAANLAMVSPVSSEAAATARQNLITFVQNNILNIFILVKKAKELGTGSPLYKMLANPDGTAKKKDEIVDLINKASNEEVDQLDKLRCK